MSQQLVDHERPGSSLSQSFSTTTIEEKEEPFLSVSVTIRPGTDNDSEGPESLGCLKGEENVSEKQSAKEETIVAEASCTEEKAALADGDKMEKEGPDLKKKGDTTEVLSGWKGYSSNIYIQPIIVKTSDEEKPSKLKKESTRLRTRHCTIHEIRRQIQLRHASEWVTKHNQRIYLKGSLKVGEIPTTLRHPPNESRRSCRSSQSMSSNNCKSPTRISPPSNDRFPNKCRLAKGFVCRNWVREYLPDPPQSQPTLNGALSVRSYVNVADPLWRQNRPQNMQNTKKKPPIRNNAYNEESVSTNINLEPNNNVKKVDLQEVCSAESTVSSEDSSENESVNLADFLFKSVSFNNAKTCSKNVREKKENFPKVETKLPKQDIEKPAERVVISAGSSFPPIAKNTEKKCASNDSRVHRPKTVNLTFANSIISGTVTKGEGVTRRSHSSKLSKSF